MIEYFISGSLFIKEDTMVDRKFLRKVLTDPKLRRTLESDPLKILGAKASKADLIAVKRILSKVSGLEAQIEALGDELLCTGGPCGIF